jgi:hypothetical protein
LYFFDIMIVFAKFYCTTALLKCRRRGSHCYSILYCLLLLTAALTAAISIAEIIYSKSETHHGRRRAHRRGRRHGRRRDHCRGRSII